MQPAPIPPNEKERMEAVHRLAILNTEPEERFDRFTKMAVEKFQIPISTITIIDSDREWYKSCQGLSEKEAPRYVSFCAHALLAKDVFIIEDTTKDARFADNPMVTGRAHIRFYAGVALYDRKTGLPIGVFCVKDTVPRKFSPQDISSLLEIAEMAEQELNKPGA